MFKNSSTNQADNKLITEKFTITYGITTILLSQKASIVPGFLGLTLHKFGLHRPPGLSLQIQLYMHAYPLEKVSARTERIIVLEIFYY